MLRDIIHEILSETNTSESTDQVLTEIKDTAKSIFFSGKIMALKDYIFDIPNEKSKLISNLDDLVENRDEFLIKFKKKIQAKIVENKLEKNLDSLLDILDYGHLKDMLKMFGL
jgi:hypothetical protein